MMFDSLELIRIHFVGRPLLISLVLMPVIVLVARWCGESLGRPARMRPVIPGIIAGISVAALFAYVAIAVYYARDPHYYDFAEPTITAVGWLFEIGLPVHHPIDSAERYAHMYGPMAFIAHGLAMGLFGPSVAVSKWLGVSAALASLALLYGALRTHVTGGRAAVLTGLCALVFLTFRNLTFWTRPEPLQLLCVSAGLYAAAAGPGLPAALAVGACAGVLLNLKITGPLYMLPVVALLYARSGLIPTLLAGSTGVAVAVLPFVAFPNVGLESYLLWVRLSAHNGLLLSTLHQNIEWALFLLMPVLLSYYAHASQARPSGPEWRWLLDALLIGVVGVVLAASKPGAGAYHLVPFLPVVCYVTAMHLRSLPMSEVSERLVPPAALAFVFAALLMALAQQNRFLTNLLERRTVDEAGDIRHFLEAHPDAVVEMGHGPDESTTLARPILVFRNRSYFLDPPAVQEHQLSGLDIPPSTIDMLRTCKVEFWLIPRGAEPFSGPNKYPEMQARPLFSEAFRQAFRETYRLQGHTTYYDVWRCRASVPSW